MVDKQDDPEKLEFMALARKRFSASAEDEKELRAKFVSDLKFASPDGDEQWDPQVKMQREMAGRPAMSFPRCHTFVQQVSNEARQKKPQIKFAPRLDQDKDTADILEGLARYIQYDSQAQVAYETAIEYSAGASFGYYRFITDYCDDDSDDLELKVLPVLDPLTIYGILVPACFNRRPMYGFVVEDMTKEEYTAKYPDTELSSLPWTEGEREGQGWVGSDSVRIAEYWTCERAKIKGKKRLGWKVKSYKINGFEILPGDDGESSETEWPGSSIPIIPVLGKQLIQEGKPKLYSVVRPQKGAQQLINYSKSRIAETLSVSPVSPFMVAAGQIKGFEQQWNSLNTVVRPYLEYNMVDNAGRPVPPPSRQVQEPPIQSLSAFVAQEVDDMKATTGIFDASLGASANEISGKAILARKDQSNLTTMHYIDNLARSFKVAGDIIAEVVPKIYDTERDIEILGEDEKQKIVTINAEHVDATGKTHNYKVKDAKMSYVVSMGQAFDSKRAESFDTMQQVLASAPQLLNIIGDLFFRQSDLAGADQIADRLQVMLPPQLQKNDEGIPPEAQAQIAQLKQQTQEATGQAQQLMMEKHGEMWKTQGKIKEIEAKFMADANLEKMKLENALAIAEVQTKAQNQQERAQMYADMQSDFHQSAHEAAMGAAQNQATQQQQAQQAQNQSQQSAQDAAQGQQAQAAQAAQQQQQQPDAQGQ